MLDDQTIITITGCAEWSGPPGRLMEEWSGIDGIDDVTFSNNRIIIQFSEGSQGLVTAMSTSVSRAWWHWVTYAALAVLFATMIAWGLGVW